MQNKKIIESGNNLIAEFMGFTSDNITWCNPKGDPCVDGLLFHTSWDWLIPVLYKIQRIRHDNPLINEVDAGDVIILRFEIARASIFIEVAKSLVNKWDITHFYEEFNSIEEYKSAIWEACLWMVKKVRGE